MHLPGRQLDPAKVKRDLWRLSQWERARMRDAAQRSPHLDATRHLQLTPARSGPSRPGAEAPSRYRAAPMSTATGLDLKHRSRALTEGPSAPPPAPI